MSNKLQVQDLTLKILERLVTPDEGGIEEQRLQAFWGRVLQLYFCCRTHLSRLVAFDAGPREDLSRTRDVALSGSLFAAQPNVAAEPDPRGLAHFLDERRGGLTRKKRAPP